MRFRQQAVHDPEVQTSSPEVRNILNAVIHTQVGLTNITKESIVVNDQSIQ
jgi:hypothetical protein